MIGAMSPENVSAMREDFDKLRPRLACLDLDERARVEASYEAAIDSLQRLVGSDPSASIKLYQAGQNVVLAMNAEFDKRAPTAAAVFAAAKSLSGLSVGTTTNAAPTKEGAKGSAQGSAPVCAPSEKNYLLGRISYYEQRRKSADAALNGVGELDTACVFAAPATAEFAVNQDAITITANAKVNIAVSGGRPPYIATWDKDPSTAGILLSQPVPDSFTVQGASTVKDDSFKLTIRDSSVARSAKVVAVTSKAKS